MKKVAAMASVSWLMVLSGLGWADVGLDDKYDLGKIVIIATKTEAYQAKIGSSTTVIDKEDIKKSGKKSVQEVLRDVCGVTVIQRGSLGGLTNIYLRGSKPGHALVMIDGVEVNDPMATDRSFDFAHLTTDNIERIEIIRGPQSTLYGSDAMGGIINIITRKGKGKPEINVSFETGSHNTFKESAGISGDTEKINYSIYASRLDSEGISRARDGSEKDNYKNTTVSSRFGYNVFDGADLNLTLRFTDAETDIDDGAYEDDPNYTIWNRGFISKLDFSQKINNLWEYKLSFSYNDVRRKYRDEQDSTDTTEDMQSWYKGDNKKVEWQNNLYVADWDIITTGFEYEEERGSSASRDAIWGDSRFERTTAESKGYYFQNQLEPCKDLFVTSGLRVDDHQLFGAEDTYKLSSAYIVSQTASRLKASWGTAFKAPSLYQLYSTENYGGGSIGDPNLRPDKSKGYDYGFEQSLFDNKITFGLTYFYNKFKNMVDYDMSASKYKNIGRAQTKGFEAESSFAPTKNLTFKINYTRTDAEDKESGKNLVRRPKNQVAFNINWSFLGKGNLNLNTDYVGHRWEDPNNTIKGKHYAKSDLFASFDVSQNFQVFARIENLFDKKYEEVRGYATQGRSFYAGVKANF